MTGVRAIGAFLVHIYYIIARKISQFFTQILKLEMSENLVYGKQLASL